MGWFGDNWQGIGGLGLGIWNAIAQGRADKRNYEMQLKHYEQQQGLIDYNKALQEQQWIREDTSYQRKVADLKAAGLNPILAAGGQGMPTTMQPVRNDPSVPYREHNAGHYLGALIDALQKKADIDHTNAQIKLLLKQAEKTEAETLLTQRETEHVDTRESKIVHDMAMDAAAHQLNMSRHELDREKAEFDWTYRSRELQLEMDKFGFSQETQRFYMGMAVMDNLLRQKGLSLQERELELKEYIHDFERMMREQEFSLKEIREESEHYIRERDLRISQTFGQRSTDRNTGIVGELLSVAKLLLGWLHP